MKRIFVLLLSMFAIVGPAVADDTVTVTHGKPPAPAYIDLGAAGASVGDQRIFKFDGKADSETVVMEWVMTTLSTPEPDLDAEVRSTTGYFTFGDAGKDRILIQGTGIYPSEGSTIKVEATLERAIIGGTGKYAGASGTVLTTHLPDGSWQHVFNID